MCDEKPLYSKYGCGEMPLTPPYVLIFEMEFRPFFRVLFYQNLEKQIDAQNYAPNDILK